MDNLVYQYILIFLMGILGMWKAIPLGFILQASPVAIFLMSASGSLTGVLMMYFFGTQIKKLFRRKNKPAKKPAKASRAAKLFDKYGVAGLGFFGAVLIGPNPAIILGLAIVKTQHKKLLFWVLAGCVFWSFIITLTGVYSIELVMTISDSFKISR
jgi:membrane protein DedA with SNARE-associated domain